MENKDIESTYNRPDGERMIDASQLLIDIPSFIKQIRGEKQWKKSDRNSITVFKSDKMRIVLMALRKNAEMKPEHPENVLSVYLIDGKISFKTGSEDLEIESGQLVALHEQVFYTIKAIKKTTMLLTIVE
jgi:quercetin dioxygenase-like cupin family protein